MRIGLQALIFGHIVTGLTAVILGALAMLSPKGPGRHPRRGRRYLIALCMVVTTGTVIAATNWSRLWHLAALGLVAVALAAGGYTVRRSRPPGWLQLHALGMSGSYVATLTAFYVDNGPRLPLWNQLPPISFWLLPTAVAAPLVLRALRRRGEQTA
jgi:hypothetical protein